MITQLFSKAKDGGKESPVDGYFLFEIKGLCSVALLKFNEGQRESFHSHAFNALTWFLSGDLEEERVDGTMYKYKRSWIPKITSKTNVHRVKANKNSWCLTLRGRWEDSWFEVDRELKLKTHLTHGRKVIYQEGV